MIPMAVTSNNNIKVGSGYLSELNTGGKVKRLTTKLNILIEQHSRRRKSFVLYLPVPGDDAENIYCKLVELLVELE
jgi:hypothetical protein